MSDRSSSGKAMSGKINLGLETLETCDDFNFGSAAEAAGGSSTGARSGRSSSKTLLRAGVWEDATLGDGWGGTVESFFSGGAN